MTKPPEETVKDLARVVITDEDIVEAMKRIPGYLDITPHDFKAIYVLAFERMPWIAWEGASPPETS